MPPLRDEHRLRVRAPERATPAFHAEREPAGRSRLSYCAERASRVVMTHFFRRRQAERASQSHIRADAWYRPISRHSRRDRSRLANEGAA
jgi:hypothetical protein